MASMRRCFFSPGSLRKQKVDAEIKRIVDEQRLGSEAFCVCFFAWVAVKELKLSYHNPETILLTMHPEYGNLI